eukprot:scaffold102560_cov22-Prasinocladus_malaysianus.AAC.1
MPMPYILSYAETIGASKRSQPTQPLRLFGSANAVPHSATCLSISLTIMTSIANGEDRASQHNVRPSALFQIQKDAAKCCSKHSHRYMLGHTAQSRRKGNVCSGGSSLNTR